MKKRIFLAVTLIFIFALATGFIYLNTVYLPVKVKALLVKELSAFSGYNVEIGKVSYSLFRGVIIDDVIVYDKAKDKRNTILTVKETACHVLFLPLLKERKIIIPLIHVASPYLNLRYEKDGTLNISRALAAKPAKEPKPRIKISFLVYKVNIFDAGALFTDERLSPVFSKSIPDLDLGLSWKPFNKVSFLAQAKILGDKQAITKLYARGEYDLASKELIADLSAGNLIVPEFNPYLTDLPLSISSGTLDNVDFDLKLKDNLLALQGKVSAKGAMLRKGDYTISGDANIAPDIEYDLKKKTLKYQAGITLSQVAFTGVPYVKTMENINGDLGLMNDKLWSNGLSFRAIDSDFTLKGTLDKFANPFVDINLAAEQVALEKILGLLPARPEGLNLSGSSKLTLHLKGYPLKPNFEAIGVLQVKEAKLENPLLKEPLTKLSGRLDFNLNGLQWTSASFNYLNKSYTSNGKLLNFDAPKITFDLVSEDLKLKSELNIKDTLVKINSFAGKYLDSEFNGKGNIDLTDKGNPGLDMYAELSLKPSDAYDFLPASAAENLKKMKLDGILKAKGSLVGKAKDYRSWTSSLDAACDALSVYGLKINNLAFSVQQNNGSLKITPITAAAYAGKLSADFSADLTPAVPVYTVKFSAADIDLSKLKADTALKDKDFSGILNLNADLRGDFQGPESIKGNGALSVKDGNLWQMSLLKGLGELFLLPEYKNIVLKEASGDLVVADKYIYTENLRLTSDQLKLDCRGKLGFDGTLDFLINNEINQTLITDSPDIRKFSTVILGGLGQALTVKLEGTLQKPTYRIVPITKELIKNLKDLILGK